jgi:hypothetical protein
MKIFSHDEHGDKIYADKFDLGAEITEIIEIVAGPAVERTEHDFHEEIAEKLDIDEELNTGTIAFALIVTVGVFMLVLFYGSSWIIEKKTASQKYQEQTMAESKMIKVEFKDALMEEELKMEASSFEKEVGTANQATNTNYADSKTNNDKSLHEVNHKEVNQSTVAEKSYLVVEKELDLIEEEVSAQMMEMKWKNL